MSEFSLVRLIQSVAKPLFARVEAINGAGVVDAVEGNKASLRTGGPTSPVISGFFFPPSLDVRAGDRVATIKLAGYQLITDVLNRNALVVAVVTRPAFADVRAYGAKGDGTTNDTAALAAAAAAAGSNGIVYLPAGTYLVSVSGVSAISPPDGQRWFGDGLASVIQTEATLTAQGNIFAVAAGRSLFLDNLKLVGPTAGIDPTAGGFVAFGVNHAGTSGKVVARRCTVSNISQFMYCSAGATAPVVLMIENCEITVHTQGVSSTARGTGAWVISRNNRFLAYGVAGSNQYHALYGVAGCSVISEGDGFYTNRGTGWAVHSFSISPVDVPEVFRVYGGYFGPGTFHGVLTPQNQVGLVQSCVFAGNVDPGVGLANYAVSNQFEAWIFDNDFRMTRTSAGSCCAIQAYTDNAKFRIRGNTDRSTTPSWVAASKTGLNWSLEGGNSFPNKPNANSVGAGSGPTTSGDWLGRALVAYGNLGNGGTLFPDASRGDYYTVAVTGATSAITIDKVYNPARGIRVTFDILNSTSVALSGITWNAVYKLAGAFTVPAIGLRRTITFVYDGTNWIEVDRAAGDI